MCGLYRSTMQQEETTFLEKLTRAIVQSYHNGAKAVKINYGDRPESMGYITLFDKYAPRIIEIEYDAVKYTIVGRYECVLTMRENSPTDTEYIGYFNAILVATDAELAKNTDLKEKIFSFLKKVQK